MAEDKLNLGAHWEDFIARQIASGEFDTAEQVIGAALRRMEADAEKLTALRAHIQEGLEDVKAGNYTVGFDPEAFLDRARKHAEQTAAE